MSKVAESCSGLQSSLASLATSGVVHTASQWTDNMANLSSAVSKFADCQGTSVASAGETASRYISQEIAVDLPTGIYSSATLG